MDSTRNWHSPLLRQVLEQVDSSVAGMSETEMTWHPAGKWSAAEILEHLALAFLVTVKGGRMVLRQKLPEIRRSTLLQRVMVAIAIEMGYFFMRVKAPKMVTPRGLGPEQARNAMYENLIEMDEVLRECQEKISRRKGFLPHPFLGPLTVRQWRKFHLVHTRHHMKQVLALRQRMKKSAAGAGPNG